VRYFRSRPDVDKKHIVLLGESQGGLVATLTAASMKKQIEKLVLVYPALCIPDDWNARYPKVSDIPETTWLWQVPLGSRYFMELRYMDPYKAVEAYHRPVLIVHGDADPVVPIVYSRRAVERFRNASLTEIPGGGHGFNPTDFQTSLERIRQFLSGE
jgi:pimeloyl-ACP methyl ester carboxylesterase